MPDDVSVVGFDDVSLAAFVDPPLTTIAQETGTMGRWAVDQLRTRLARSIRAGERASRPGEGAAHIDPEEAEPAPHVVLPVHLVIRGSTGPASAG